jgi:hypothetical protein
MKAEYGFRIGVAALFAAALIYSAQTTRPAVLAVRIFDAAGAPTPVRVRLVDAQGNPPRANGAAPRADSPLPIPKQAVAVMWGRQDRAEGYLLQPDGSFYVDGNFDVNLPPGNYTATISKGNEYLRQTLNVSLKPGEHVTRDCRLKRWIDMPQRGWYSADDHIHIQRSPRENSSILRWIAAEDIHVGNILEMGDFWATYFTQYAFGDKGRYTESGRILSPGQEEPRTPEIGHTISLGASAMVRNQRDYYSFDRLFDKVRELGGVTGFAHQGMSFHGYRGMTLNVLRGKVDFLELAQFCVPEGPLALDHYYHFLDLGYRLTALAGSDFPWCGRERYGFPQEGAQIGNARFYAYTGGPLTFERWFAAVKAGHTFVTTGPAIMLKVNDKLPGDTLDVAPGTKLHITAEAYGDRDQVPLKSLEIIAHGKSLKKVEADGSGRLSVDLDLPADHGIWIAAKCEAGKMQVAHTTPVYVTVNGGGFYNPATAKHYLELSESYLRELEQEFSSPNKAPDFQAPRQRVQLERQIADARTVLSGLAQKLK